MERPDITTDVNDEEWDLRTTSGSRGRLSENSECRVRSMAPGFMERDHGPASTVEGWTGSGSIVPPE